MKKIIIIAIITLIMGYNTTNASFDNFNIINSLNSVIWFNIFAFLEYFAFAFLIAYGIFIIYFVVLIPFLFTKVKENDKNN